MTASLSTPRTGQRPSYGARREDDKTTRFEFKMRMSIVGAIFVILIVLLAVAIVNASQTSVFLAIGSSMLVAVAVALDGFRRFRNRSST